MITGVNNVGVAVRDLQRSLSFYRVLGFEVVGEDETPGATIRAGTAVLYLFQTSGPAPVGHRQPDLVGNPTGIDHISFDVSDVDRLYEALRGQVDFEGVPEDQPWGYRAVSLTDPDGNRLYFLSAIQGGQ
ncbi:glyoxalase [Kyrpidia spormannii]|uniref:Glyoxalase n=1 Tax=Kyrpidia spormannii TaxID=2055160 RepID=A0A2K8N8R5_9BACL|nr:VOC family protein [Kyrpidia spormannii]ATY85505.1 glyoxalase [Kyrpidia spormannii]